MLLNLQWKLIELSLKCACHAARFIHWMIAENHISVSSVQQKLKCGCSSCVRTKILMFSLMSWYTYNCYNKISLRWNFFPKSSETYVKIKHNKYKHASMQMFLKKISCINYISSKRKAIFTEELSLKRHIFYYDYI